MKEQDLINLFMSESYKAFEAAVPHVYTLILPVIPPPGEFNEIHSVSKIDALKNVSG